MKNRATFWLVFPLMLGLFACSNSGESDRTDASTSPPPAAENPVSNPLPVPTTPPADMANQRSATSGATSGESAAVSPEIRQQILTELYSQQKALNLCDGFLDQNYSQTESQVFALDAETYLVHLQCSLAAYQASFEFLTYQKKASGGEFKPMTLTVFNENPSGKPTQENVRTVGGMPTYNPETRSLTIFTKFRGVGDCGSLANYQLKDGEFQLVKYQAKFACDGNAIDPEKYPQIFP
ncbi:MULTISPECIES: DUF1176 domain-containing protein [Planktothricoides]|uniref:DUF1176 domain-containing protein n=1 Tax=Planktothricoides raciborskii GIHE-MW2 TaxID=2792601 RepID=A0AAU8J8R9_9CYAN|nr:DUF1176 domain-containing protein [Planktothricoides sp. SR001]